MWAFDEHGRLGVQADSRFSSEKGRNLNRGVAEQLGFRERRGAAERIRRYVGLVGAVDAMVVAVALVVTALLGRF